MIAPAAMPPTTPAATPQPKQRASALVGAATEASASAPPIARTVTNLRIEFSQVESVATTCRARERSWAGTADHAELRERSPEEAGASSQPSTLRPPQECDC